MKKTIIALLAVSSCAMAFENAEWKFDDTLAVTGAIPGAALQPKINNDATVTPTYVASGLTAGSQVGDFFLTEDLGQAVSLTSTQRVTVGGNAYWGNGNGALDTHNFTMSAWLKFDSVAGENMVFGSGSGTGAGVAMVVYNGKLDLLAKGKAHYYFSDTTLVKANEWTNLAITYNASTREAVGYINGQSIGTLTLNANPFNGAGGSGIVFGSGSFDSKQGDFAGAIADFKILDGVLTGDDLMSAISLTSTSPSVPEPATATLSLLALAGLCARRRRH